MPQRPCTFCNRPTGLIIDGDPICASCAAKVPDDARFKPASESAAEDAFGMPDLPPMPPLPKLNVTAARRQRAPLMGSCPRCGMDQHYGLCKGQGLVSNITQNLKPKDSPVLLKNPNPTSILAPEADLPASPPPSQTIPAAGAADDIFVISLEDLPAQVANHARSKRNDRYFSAILGLADGKAAQFPCQDLKAAQSLQKALTSRASRHRVKLHTRTHSTSCYAWVERAGVSA